MLPAQTAPLVHALNVDRANRLQLAFSLTTATWRWRTSGSEHFDKLRGELRRRGLVSPPPSGLATPLHFWLLCCGARWLLLHFVFVLPMLLRPTLPRPCPERVHSAGRCRSKPSSSQLTCRCVAQVMGTAEKKAEKLAGKVEILVKKNKVLVGKQSRLEEVNSDNSKDIDDLLKQVERMKAQLASAGIKHREAAKTLEFTTEQLEAREHETAELRVALPPPLPPHPCPRHPGPATRAPRPPRLPRSCHNAAHPLRLPAAAVAHSPLGGHVRVVRDSNSGHQLPWPPANCCPISASRTAQVTNALLSEDLGLLQAEVGVGRGATGVVER